MTGLRIRFVTRATAARKRYARRASLAPLAVAILALTGCPDDVQKEFRDAAGESLQQGVSAILDGFVDGVFAVLEPEDNTTTTGA